MNVIKFLVEIRDLGVLIKMTAGKLSVKAEKSVLSIDIKRKLYQFKENIIECFEKLKIDNNCQLAFASFQQRRVWFIDMLGEGSVEYNLSSLLKYEGEINLNILNKSYNEILRRHESLRTTFIEENGEPYQLINAWKEQFLGIIDLTILSEKDKNQALKEINKAESLTRFDLSTDVLIKMKLVHLGVKNNVFIYTMHHIISDGWSLSILSNEFATLFNAYKQGHPSPLKTLAQQYADYAHWQRNYLKGDVYKEYKEFWNKNLGGIPEVHNLPLDYPRQEKKSIKGSYYECKISKSLKDKFYKFCRSRHCTLFMGLHSIFSLLISRYSNQNDIVIGTPIANREQEGIKDLVGYFINTLVLRSNLSEVNNFEELIGQSKNYALKAYQYQQLPFENLVKSLEISRANNYDPVFQIMLVLQNYDKADTPLEGLSLKHGSNGAYTVLFDIVLHVTDEENEIVFLWTFNHDIFKKSTIQRMAKSYLTLLEAVISSSECPLEKLPLINEIEKSHIIAQSAHSFKKINKNLIHQQFEANARLHPDGKAIIFGEKILSYMELNRCANQLAWYLLEKNVRRGDIVGICLTRSPHIIISILAINKIGAVFLIIDMDYPDYRKEFICKDASIRFLICHLEYMFKNSDDIVTIDICSPEIQENISNHSDTNVQDLESIVSVEDIAYVIYTSGSTGEPKGIMINHRNLLSYYDAVQEIYNVSVTDNVLQFSSLSFDIFIEEVFICLLSRATLTLRNDEMIQGCSAFWDFVALNHITILSLPTAFWHLLASQITTMDKARLLDLRLVIVGGEKMSSSMLLKWQQYMQSSIRLLNTYGPTETTVISTCFDVTQYLVLDKDVPIGKSLSNTSIYILDKYRKIVPIGVFGEIYIGGGGVTLGYLNRDTLTKLYYVDNPYVETHSKIFRTGDIARYMDNGELEILGRTDSQIKYRGFRIEPEEIEHRLNQFTNIVLSKVILQYDKDKKINKESKLIAYIQLECENEINSQQEFIQALRRYLQNGLPNYMLPAGFVIIEKIPLSVNGKVDISKLIDFNEILIWNEYIAARTQSENELLKIWADLLSLRSEKISICANFFELGGDSLLMVHMLSQIRKQFDVNLKLGFVFQEPNIEAIASEIDLEMSKQEFYRNRHTSMHEIEW